MYLPRNVFPIKKCKCTNQLEHEVQDTTNRGILLVVLQTTLGIRTIFSRLGGLNRGLYNCDCPCTITLPLYDLLPNNTNAKCRNLPVHVLLSTAMLISPTAHSFV
ncbi:unnamed protein product [Amoebophrya sp. A120]|nr:unnamed protein product [Amoebophrya sp. A120]|eukprot:GSA120T00000301001.1